MAGADYTDCSVCGVRAFYSAAIVPNLDCDVYAVCKDCKPDHKVSINGRKPKYKDRYDRFNREVHSYIIDYMRAGKKDYYEKLSFWWMEWWFRYKANMPVKLIEKKIEDIIKRFEDEING